MISSSCSLNLWKFLKLYYINFFLILNVVIVKEYFKISIKLEINFLFKFILFYLKHVNDVVMTIFGWFVFDFLNEIIDKWRIFIFSTNKKFITVKSNQFLNDNYQNLYGLMFFIKE